MTYKCILADLDGTLLRSDKTISPETKKFLEDFMADGGIFVPATGRALFSLPANILELNGVRYAITENGVSVIDLNTRKAIFQTYLPEHCVTGILELIKDKQAVIECFVDGQPYIDSYDYNNWGVRGGHPKREQYVKSTRKPVDDIRSFILNNKHRMDCIDLTVDSSRREEIADKLKATLPEIYITNSEIDLLEISNINSGKHVGIPVICELYKITPDEIIAFGDNDNDVEMLKHVGLGVAVANCSDKCREAADVITLSNNEDGMLLELKKHFNIQS